MATWNFVRPIAQMAERCACLCLIATVLLAFGLADDIAAGDISAGVQPAYADQATRIVIGSTGATVSADLFPNFKNVMPGDELSQDIVVENRDAKGRTGKIYLQMAAASDDVSGGASGSASGGSPDDNAGNLLSQLKLTVSQDDKVLFSGAPCAQGGQSVPIYLGVLEKGESLELTVKLVVPIELGNEFSFSSGALDWVFQLDEYNPDDDSGDDDNGGGSAETGDHLGRLLAIGIALTLAAGLLACLARRKSRE